MSLRSRFFLLVMFASIGLNTQAWSFSTCLSSVSSFIRNQFEQAPVRSGLFAFGAVAAATCFYRYFKGSIKVAISAKKDLSVVAHKNHKKFSELVGLDLKSESPAKKQVALTKDQLKEVFKNPENFKDYVFPHEAAISAIVLNKSGTLLVYGDAKGTLSIKDMRTKETLDSLEYPAKDNEKNWSPGIRALAMHPTKNLIAIGYENGVVGVDRMNTRRQTPVPLLVLYDFKAREYYCLDESLRGHNDWVTSVDFSPDGNLLASISDDKDVRIWDVESKKCVHTLSEHKAFGLSVSFNADGSLLASGGFDGVLALWNPKSGHLLWSKKMNKAATVDEKDPSKSQGNSAIAAFDPCDPFIVAVTTTNNEIKVLQFPKEITQKIEPAVIKGFQIKEARDYGFGNIAYNSTGTAIACRDWNCTTFVWNILNMNLTSFIPARKGRFCSMVFMPNQHLLMGYSQINMNLGLLFDWDLTVQHGMA